MTEEDYERIHAICSNSFTNFFKIVQKKLKEEGYTKLNHAGYTFEILSSMLSGTCLNFIDEYKFNDQETKKLKNIVMDNIIKKAITFNESVDFINYTKDIN